MEQISDAYICIRYSRSGLLLSRFAFSQGIEFGPGGVRIEPPPYYQGRSASGGQRREWRRACSQGELGEEGQDNCRDIDKSAAKAFAATRFLSTHEGGGTYGVRRLL